MPNDDHAIGKALEILVKSQAPRPLCRARIDMAGILCALSEYAAAAEQAQAAAGSAAIHHYLQLQAEALWVLARAQAAQGNSSAA